MSFTQQGFQQVGAGTGSVSVDFGGESIEMPYAATYHVNAAGTVALAETTDEASGEVRSLFLSHAPGVVLTFSGQQTSAVPVEGVLLNVVASTEREAVLAAHLRAVGDRAVADRATLAQEIQTAPQRAAEGTMKLMALMMAAFEG